MGRYVGDKSGHPVMDSRGECVRTRHWTPALAIPGCEGGKKAAAAEPVKVAVAKPAPKRLSLDAMTLFDVDSANLRSAGKG